MTPQSSRSIDVEGRTVREAIQKGLAILGVSRNRVAIQVLAEETQGLFGMRGAKPAKVRITIKPTPKEKE